MGLKTICDNCKQSSCIDTILGCSLCGKIVCEKEYPHPIDGERIYEIPISDVVYKCFPMK